MEMDSTINTSASTFAVLHPYDYHRKFLLSSVRPDGRGFASIRPTLVQINPLNSPNNGGLTVGSSLVSIGRTSILSGCRIEIGRPLAINPDHGRIVINIQQQQTGTGNAAGTINNNMNPNITTHNTSNELNTIAISQSILDSLLLTNSINLSQLNLVSGISCIVLYLDLLVLSYDGNLYDTAQLAVITTLKAVQLPRFIIDESNPLLVPIKVDYSSNNNNNNPSTKLVFNQLPLSLTISIFDSQNQYYYTDPTASETIIESTSITILYSIIDNDNIKFLSVQKFGGIPINQSIIEWGMKQTKLRVEQLNKIIQQAFLQANSNNNNNNNNNNKTIL